MKSQFGQDDRAQGMSITHANNFAHGSCLSDSQQVRCQPRDPEENDLLLLSSVK